MLIILIRTVILYLLVIFALRLMGKKQLGELQPSELVTTILISNIATLSLEDPNLPMLAGIVPILLIVCLDVLMSVVTMKQEKVRKLITGSPRIIIKGGEIDQSEMHTLRYTLDDIMEAMRDGGFFDIREVQYAIVETTGKINFFGKERDDSGKAHDPPSLIIKDGAVNESGLAEVGLDEAWLRRVLLDAAIPPGHVFLLTAKSRDDFYIVRKEKTR